MVCPGLVSGFTKSQNSFIKQYCLTGNGWTSINTPTSYLAFLPTLGAPVSMILSGTHTKADGAGSQPGCDGERFGMCWRTCSGVRDCDVRLHKSTVAADTEHAA